MTENEVGLVGRRQFVDFFGGELDFERGERVLQLGEFAGADDGGRDPWLGQDPGKGDLGVGNTSALGDTRDGVDDGEVAER